MWRRAFSGSSRVSMPSTRSLPCDWRTSVAAIFKKVVLPAPLRPNRARNSPHLTFSVTPASAVKWPNVLRMSSDSSANVSGMVYAVIPATTTWFPVSPALWPGETSNPSDLVCVWIRAATGRAGICGPVLTRGNLPPDQGIEVSRRFEIFDLLEDDGGFCVHFRTDLLVILAREFAALVFEVEVLDIPEDDLLLALQQVPLGLFDDCRFKRFLFAEQRRA